jgi:two-component system nitrogen regulation sensor histidine kinase NtrY
MDVAHLLLGGLGVAVGAVGGGLALRAAGALERARREASTLRDRLDARDAEARRETDAYRAIVESTPTAVVLFAESGRIALTNAAARDFLFHDSSVDGQNFLTMLAHAPEALRRAVLADGDELLTLESDGERETFHVSKHHFLLAGEPHALISVKPMGAAIAREENAGLKKAIRIIGHEIGNSMGPIASLLGSARVLATRPDPAVKLASVFDTVEERLRHLQSFLESYARFSRLPAPRLAAAAWGPTLDAVRAMWPRVRVAPAPQAPGHFDAAQIQQVVINLVKNAYEAGGREADVAVLVEQQREGGWRLSVLDRGAGMSDEVMRSALMPFFTTKPSGSGLGLALCREIVEQHGGRLRLARREGGGMSVSFWLPDRDRALPALSGSRVRLDLTRS